MVKFVRPLGVRKSDGNVEDFRWDTVDFAPVAEPERVPCFSCAYSIIKKDECRKDTSRACKKCRKHHASCTKVRWLSQLL